MSYALLVAFILYFGILFAVGLLHYFKTKTSSDFMLGGRGVNYWVTAIAAHASDMSAWLFMGFPAVIYTQGLVGAWIAVGLIGGMLFSWHYIAQKLRLATEKYHVLTLSSFFEKRFNDQSGLIRLASSLIILLFFSVYIGAGLTGMGRVFESIFNISYHNGMMVGLLASLFYIIVGGFTALAWNHFFQGMFLLIVVMFVPLYALLQLGSTTPITTNALINNVSLSLIPPFSWSHTLEIINGIAWGIGYLGMPHVVINYMGIDNPEHIKRAKYLGMVWLMLSLAAAVGIGLVGLGYFPNLANSELVFVKMVNQLFNPFLAGIILCAMLAATMSTIDTQILVAANSLTEDFYKKLLHKKATDKELVWVSRLSIIVVAFFGYCIGYQNSSTVMGLATYAWSGLAAAFSPIMIAALYDKNYNSKTILTALISGALIAAIWPLINTSILSLIPGVIISSIILLIF